MARVSIYVPDDLKKQMDAVGDVINWSDVARPTFLMALATHQHKGKHTMTTAIERLRASKAKSDKEDEITGKADGRSWAENDAEYNDLRRVAEIDLENALRINAFNGLSMLDTLYNALDEGRNLSAEDFKEEVFGDRNADITDAYAWAFIEGAQEFYNEVADKL